MRMVTISYALSEDLMNFVSINQSKKLCYSNPNPNPNPWPWSDENGDNITYTLSEDLSFASINPSKKLWYTNPNP